MERMREEDQAPAVGWFYRPRIIQAVAIITGLYLIYYLVWRTLATLNPQAMWLSVLLLAAEALGFVTFCLYALMTWNTETKLPFELKEHLSVDVFVPTYNEELDILEATLTGCNAINYPHTTYVLDDGRRPQVLALAQRMGCRYLTRADNANAKAGNINAALEQTSGDFIVVIDADTVPQPDFLDRTLGYFVDERIALVQLPQEFYNVDSLQYPAARDVRGWHEQALFYRVIQPGKNRWNAAFWCGSPAVLRRKALLDVGGVATETVTEDIHTSMRLHARGWKTVYHKEALAFGVAPETMLGFSTQRLRWAQGSMQLLRRRELFSLMRKMTMAQRLNYLASVSAYFEPFPKLAFLLVPSVILLTGQLPIDVDGPTFFVRWLAYFVAGALGNTALGRGNFNFLRIEVYNILKMFTFMWASTVVVWPRHLKFKVTPKGKDETVNHREWSSVRAQIIVLGLLTATMAIGVANIWWQITASFTRLDVVLVALFWTAVNLTLVSLAIAEGLHRHHRRQTYRFPVNLRADISPHNGMHISGRAQDLSIHGIGLVLYDGSTGPQPVCSLMPGDEVIVRLNLLHHAISLHATVARFDESDHECVVGARFHDLSIHERGELLNFLFVVLPRSQAHTCAWCPAPIHDWDNVMDAA
jgi:cellulose synthase (UDP-forming)